MTMRRRSFFKMITGAAAAAALPVVRTRALADSAAPAFNRLGTLCRLLRHSRDGAHVLCVARCEDCKGTVERVGLAPDGVGASARATRSRRLLGWGTHG